MVILDVFSKNLQLTYQSTVISKATIFVLICGVLSVVLPFIVAYRSGNFWVKREVFTEQPDVRFRGELLFIATTDNIEHPVLECSTFAYIQETMKFIDCCGTIKVAVTDNNFDGKAEELRISLQMILPNNTKITSISIVIPLDFRLYTVCPMHMQSALIFQEFLPAIISEYQIIGDLRLVQTSPLICKRKMVNSAYNYSIIEDLEDINSYKLSNIIEKYTARNVTTVLTNVYTSFETLNEKDFNIRLKVRFPEDTIYYKPSFWQILKWAWIQYLAIYIVTSWLITVLKTYVFSKKLVLFYENNPIKKQQ